MTNTSFRCMCGGFHFITIEDEDDQAFVAIEDAVRVYGGWWDRLKTAWHILTRGECVYTEVALTPDVALTLAVAIMDASGVPVTDELAIPSPEELSAMLSAPRSS